ncbi:response regulator transcription factor [Flavobacterium sp. CYK-55]|uniref:LytR/AlgR family response regulator transcription factor n=1 Tax=Flavobacterium sp. CYK-55 TaxID=2835529 RepID=UPI001BCCEFC3|nr:response regulator transcription factor [Flavobacterium sp. CYK-55]MBS7786024.1 response regulator transcription factor [Flavobacterium sp. CYK-55]
MSYSYIIIDDNSESTLKTLAVAARFRELQFIASASSYQEGLNLILEYRPTFVFLEVDPKNPNSGLSFGLINELHRFLKVLPKIIITTNNAQMALQALQYGAFDYLPKPFSGNDLIKTILKHEKCGEAVSPYPSAPQFRSYVEQPVIEPVTEANHIQEMQVTHEEVTPEVEINQEQIDAITEAVSESIIESQSLTEIEESQILSEEQEILNKPVVAEIVTKEEKPLIICVKSYGDYRFIEAKDICYLQADNNSTDIHLFNGEMITAFKTLKHFENVLSSPFVRIHNSYIVNIDYVSRIHTGNSVCYIKNTTTKLPFSKSYKENVDAIISSITNGNYLEI